MNGRDARPFVRSFLAEASDAIARLDIDAIERTVTELAALRERGGRLFVLGVGGSAANASHAVNDFRKLCDIEAYAPTDNVSELTARTNDEGWETVFSAWLEVSRVGTGDAILVFSVGGGSIERNVSANIVRAVETAERAGATILGVVGRDGGYVAKRATAVVIVPAANDAHATPLTEALCAVVWHGIVSHPALKKHATKWESLARSRAAT